MEIDKTLAAQNPKDERFPSCSQFGSCTFIAHVNPFRPSCLEVENAPIFALGIIGEIIIQGSLSLLIVYEDRPAPIYNASSVED